jgi:hypothetical protein
VILFNNYQLTNIFNMGFFSDLFGGSSKPRVTEKEFKKARSELALDGMSRRHRDRVEEIFSGDMYEKVTSTQPRGIDADELEMRLRWMRENKSKHGLSDSEIDKVEARLRKRL